MTTIISRALGTGLIVAFCIGCSGYSRRDFEGKTFVGRLAVDSIDRNGQARSGVMSMVYTFKPEGKGRLKAEFGAEVIDRPITWQIKNDSLTLSAEIVEGLTSSRRWALSSIAGGYLISDGGNNMELIERR